MHALLGEKRQTYARFLHAVEDATDAVDRMRELRASTSDGGTDAGMQEAREGFRKALLEMRRLRSEATVLGGAYMGTLASAVIAGIRAYERGNRIEAVGEPLSRLVIGMHGDTDLSGPREQNLLKKLSEYRIPGAPDTDTNSESLAAQ